MIMWENVHYKYSYSPLFMQIYSSLKLYAITLECFFDQLILDVGSFLCTVISLLSHAFIIV